MQSVMQRIFANVPAVFERVPPPLELVIDVGAKGTVLILLAIAAAFLLRHASAAVRHRLWGLMFFGLLILPLVSYALPEWRVPLLPPRAAEAVVETQQPARSIETRSDSVDGRIAEPRGSGLLALTPPVPFQESSHAKHAPSEYLPDSPSSKTAGTPGDPRSVGRKRTVIALIIWSLGAAFVLLPLLVGILNNALLWLRSERMGDADWRCLMEETQSQIGLRRRVDLLFADRPMIPVTWGLFRPIVLLPEQARGWTSQMRRFVLLHELSHVKRWDVGFQMLARVACALYWFHPLVWYALRQIRIERELACDDLVLSTGEPAADYAEQLVEIVRTFRPVRLVAAVAMAQSHSLEKRITAILDRTRPRLPLSARSATLLFVVAIGFVAGVAVVEPSALGAGSNAIGNDSPALTSNGSPLEQNPALQDADDVFTELEPGVRILGKPSLNSTLGEVLDFAPLPDGNRIVTVCRDGLKIWDVEKNAIVKSLPFEQPVTTCRALQFSNDRQTLAVSTSSYGNSDDNQPGTVILVDLELRQKAKLVVDDRTSDSDLSGKNQVTALAFSPDDSEIALATGQAVLLFDVDSGELIRTYDMGVNSASQTRLMFERNQILAFGSQSQLIDLQTETVSRLPKLNSVLTGCSQSCFDDSSNRLFGLYARGPDKLRAIHLSDGKSEAIEFGDEDSAPFKLTLSPDGSLLAVCYFDRRNTKTGMTVSMKISVLDTKKFELKYSFANLPMRPIAVEFAAANEGLLMAFNMGAGVQYLEFDPQQVEQKPDYQLNRPLRSVLLSDDGSHLVGSFMNSLTSSWEWTTGEETEVDNCNVFFPAELTNNYFAMSQRGTSLSLVHHTFGTNQSKEVRNYKMRQPIIRPLAGYLFGLPKEPADRRAYFVIPTTVAVNESKTELHVGVLDTFAGVRIQSFAIPGYQKIRDELFKRSSVEMMGKKIAITNDGKRFAVVDSGKLKVIDVESRETMFENSAHNSAPLFFSKTRDWLAISNQNGVTILDPETGDTLKKIDAPQPLVAYAFGSSHLLVVSSKAGSKVRIFDTQTWETTLEHSTKTAKRVSATISSDGRRVAFALDDCRLEFWDIGELKE